MTPTSAQTRTPPDLKWLLNERAAINGVADVLRKDVNTLRRLMGPAEAYLERLRVRLSKCELQLQAKQRELDAFDEVIALAYPTVRSNAGGSVRAWAGSYGKRGSLKACVLAHVRAAAPNPVSIREVFTVVVAEFNLTLPTRTDERCVRRNLRKLLADAADVIERLPKSDRWETGLYRWRAACTLSELAGEPRGDDDQAGADPLGPQMAGERASGNHG